MSKVWLLIGSVYNFLVLFLTFLRLGTTDASGWVALVFTVA